MRDRPANADGHPITLSAGRWSSRGHGTHERQLLCEGLVLDGVIECPKHIGRFDYRTGAARGIPAITPLRVYPVKVENGTVYLDLG